MSIQKSLIEHVLYPLMERRKGNQIRRYCRELVDSAASQDQWPTVQRQRLTKLLQTCVEKVPAYQNLGITPEEIARDPYATLQKIPPLEKPAFQADPDAYLNPDYPKAQLIPNETGGSTGLPLRFYMDRYTVEHYEAARWRGLSWRGITYGSRSVMVWGNPVDLSAQQQRSIRWKEQLLKNRKVIPAYNLKPEQRTAYIRLLNRYQPEYLYGYASALYSLAQLLHPAKDSLKPHLKAVVSTSETLYPEQRQCIAETFGCPVVNEYGARDAGILAYECPCGGLHLTAENVLLEIVDPVTKEPVQPGQSGLILTTDLNNLAMPRLRYALGDTATISPDPCPCGMSLPLIGSLDGRSDALFQLQDGTLIHGHIIYQLVSKYTQIKQVQFTQTSTTQGELRLVMDRQYEDQAIALRDEIMHHLPGVQVTHQFVDAIAPSGSGKVRYAVRTFPLG